MPKVKKIVDSENRPGYIYKCICGKSIKYFWDSRDTAPDHLEVCFYCINLKL